MPEDKICKTIKYSIKDKIAWVTLNRPEIHNAFDETMISELLELYKEFSDMSNVRVVVITGEGKSFCAGADLNWMGGVIKYS